MNWKNINVEKIQTYTGNNKSYHDWIDLTKDIVRDVYWELSELFLILFLGRYKENKYKIRPPGTMHQARWMPEAICTKILLPT